MNILITGGYGYVGTALIPLLKDHNLTIVDNLMSGSIPSGLPAHRFIHADIRHDNLKLVIEPMDVVIHLAAIVGEPACQVDTILAYQVNVLGTRNIVRAMNKSQRLIFTSTSSVYGNRPGEYVTENDRPLPINTYGEHKVMGEAITKNIPDHIIFRPVTAFGTTKRTRLDLLVNTLIYEALTTKQIKVYEPNLIRPIIYVQDFARLLALAANTLNAGIYNIGDPLMTQTKRQLATKIAQYCNAKLIDTEGISLDLRDYDVSFDKIINTGYTFTENSLMKAISELAPHISEIQQNPDNYSAPAKVKAFRKGVY